ncbi:MAG: EVE domain-containing protein [Gemmatimonadaceae bacterium]
MTARKGTRSSKAANTTGKKTSPQAAKETLKPSGAKAAKTSSMKSTGKTPAKNAEKKWTLPSVAREAGERRYWLIKSEPDVFSFDDLMRAPSQTTCWDGVRNNQARIYLRDQMKIGDGILYYHSGGEEPAIVGIAKVVREGYPDLTAFDAEHAHFDAKAKAANPWIMVDVRAVSPLAISLTLSALRETAALGGMVLLQKGSRLSVQPVRAEEWATILRLGGVSE